LGDTGIKRNSVVPISRGLLPTKIGGTMKTVYYIYITVA
jgi:hypothetical protein